jgi:membrane protein YdbS with pleckstrin-like domain
MKGCSWIEAVFVLLTPVAYILTPYYINLWNLGLIHPGMLMVLFSVHVEFL